MKTLRYHFLKDCESDSGFMENQAYIAALEAKTNPSKRIDTHTPSCTLSITSDTLSKDGTIWLHAVEAVRKSKSMFYIRVITKNGLGVNINIPIKNDLMYEKFRDLRYQIRNRDMVKVTFDCIFVQSAIKMPQLWYMAYDFKMCDDEPYKHHTFIEI